MTPQFKHTVRAAAFCSALLLLGFVLLFHTSAAKSDPLADLLKLPAPPPPNPLVPNVLSSHDASFYRADSPPPDNAPIQDLIDYWSRQGLASSTQIRSGAVPSSKVVERLIREGGSRPDVLPRVLNILPSNKETIDAVKSAYDGMTSVPDSGDEEDANSAKAVAGELKQWLKFNSPYFADELRNTASKAKDNASHYIDTETENSVIALTEHDWDRAAPLVGQMYGDHTQPVTQVVAMWALYKHALQTDSGSDIERYRSELMHMVEDRSLPDGVRDKANDALTHEKDWPGREDWTISLFEDETLVNMQTYTMLTTLMTYSPTERYISRLIDLTEKTKKPLVRAAAIRSLMLVLQRDRYSEDANNEQDRAIVRAMLPWLEDQNWAPDLRSERSNVVQKLAQMVMPEAVPGLIRILDEKHAVSVPDYGSNSFATNTNRGVYAAMAAANAAMSAANAASRAANTATIANRAVLPERTIEQYPFRPYAVMALAKQKDQRAVPALRRALDQSEGYEVTQTVRAIYACGGFSLPEQLDAVDTLARSSALTADDEEAGLVTGITNMSNSYSGYAYANRLYGGVPRSGPPTAAQIRKALGEILLVSGADVTDELARAVVSRIGELDRTDPQLAASYRKVVMRWPNSAVNILFLSDVKLGNATAETMVRLLATREELRNKLPGDVASLQTGVPRSVGFSACMLEDKNNYDAILESAPVEAKIALLACGRLVRTPISVPKAASLLTAKEPLLASAAEAYLTAEDSPAARAAVLARHPGEAMVLGARSNFPGSGGNTAMDLSDREWVAALMYAVGSPSLYYGWGGSSNDPELTTIEQRLRDEVKKDDSLFGIYAFDKNYIRIYRDRAMFSWDDDESRYYERPLTQDEFEEIKSYLAAKHADELPPFLHCGGGYCSARELLMLGRNGGRRVYIAGKGDGSENDDFFAGLDRYFEYLKKTPGTLKYSLARDVPGLEIALADEDLDAITVWTSGDDLRVAVCSEAVREKVGKEIEKVIPADAPADDDTPPEDLNEANRYLRRQKLTQERAFEGCNWQHVAGGKAAGFAPQPSDVEYIPIRDGMPAQPTQQQWKARAGSVEIRAGGDGLYSISRGTSTLIAKGDFSTPVITPNGRWAVAIMSDDDGEGIVRVDLVTKKVHKVEDDRIIYSMHPLAYVPSVGKVLLAQQYSDYEGEGAEESDDVETPNDPDTSSMVLLDPATGAVTPAAGELRPLAHQSFRSLQRMANGSGYWAAIADQEKRTTAVGVYDPGKFTFKAVTTLPNIVFNSMSMWVDEGRNKLYFAYRGHLLSVPFKAQVPAVSQPATPPTRPTRRH